VTSRLAILALAATAVLPQGARAEGPTPEAEAALDACVKKAGMVDLDIKDCYVELANTEDVRLNANWTRLLKAVGSKDSEVGAALLAEQRAWIAYKEAACTHYLFAGGTLNRISGQTCYVELITRRADELAHLADYYHETYSPE
jgi:uncharacterized protein YecT (DUF1311 family)